MASIECSIRKEIAPESPDETEDSQTKCAAISISVPPYHQQTAEAQARGGARESPLGRLVGDSYT